MSVTCDSKFKAVDLSKLALKRGIHLPDAIKEELEKYLKYTCERYPNEGTFYHDIKIILRNWEDVYLAVDSQNNVYGYMFTNSTNFRRNITIAILEVIRAYRHKGVGRFMVSEWEKLIQHNHKEYYQDEQAEECTLTIESTRSALPFWNKMGYFTRDERIYWVVKKQLHIKE